MKITIILFEYLVYTGGEQSVIMIDPQSSPTKRSDTYNPVFSESPNLKIFNCDMRNVWNTNFKYLKSRKGPP